VIGLGVEAQDAVFEVIADVVVGVEKPRYFSVDEGVDGIVDVAQGEAMRICRARSRSKHRAAHQRQRLSVCLCSVRLFEIKKVNKLLRMPDELKPAAFDFGTEQQGRLFADGAFFKDDGALG